MRPAKSRPCQRWSRIVQAAQNSRPTPVFFSSHRLAGRARGRDLARRLVAARHLSRRRSPCPRPAAAGATAAAARAAARRCRARRGEPRGREPGANAGEWRPWCAARRASCTPCAASISASGSRSLAMQARDQGGDRRRLAGRHRRPDDAVDPGAEGRHAAHGAGPRRGRVANLADEFLELAAAAERQPGAGLLDADLPGKSSARRTISPSAPAAASDSGAAVTTLSTISSRLVLHHLVLLHRRDDREAMEAHQRPVPGAVGLDQQVALAAADPLDVGKARPQLQRPPTSASRRCRSGSAARRSCAGR